ncbi:acyl-CoA thioesterase [Ekhidna sp.]|jgi:acyl-CoA hydrolase|uniref:acyl-CoA thioesterase n=1 Tax=Ekhidna sp. TaxID=2608089 RepID=UPI0032EB0679
MHSVNKKVADSVTDVTYIVMPNHTNPLGYLRGGMLMEWMDIAAEITAQKHGHCVALTASIDSVSFDGPIKSGDTVYIRASITRAFTTSMEIFVEAWASSLPDMKMHKTNDAIFTFVAIDESGKPVKVPSLEVETDEEKKRYNAALKRKENRSK